MRRSVYRELTNYLLADCRTAIAQFCKSPHNEQVFAFALECDPRQAGLVLGINTEAGFKQALASKFPNARPDEIDGLTGIRFRCSDFAFTDFSFSRDTHDLLMEIAEALNGARTQKTIERHTDTLERTIARVILMLERDMNSLNCTELFIAFASRLAMPEAARIRLMRSTISDAAFDTLFPELRAFEEKLRQVDQFSAAERASFWAVSALDLVLNRHTPDAERFRSNGVSTDAMIDNAIHLGAIAVSPLLGVLEEAARAPQLHADDSDMHGERTESCEFSTRVLDALRTIRLVDGPSVERLNTLMHELANNSDNPGPIASELSKLLHDLRPSAYPRPARGQAVRESYDDSADADADPADADPADADPADADPADADPADADPADADPADFDPADDAEG